MKLRKLLSLMLTGAMIATFTVGCSTSESQSGAGQQQQSAAEKTIKIFQFKVEIANQLEELRKEYEAEHPGIKLEIETIGGGADYASALKARFASGQEPDIFNNGGFNDLTVWQDKLADLSNEPWVGDLIEGTQEPITKDGKLYGQPMNIEGYGFLYNKDLFAKAGITEIPTTLSALEDACKKLEASGVTPFSNGYQENWVLGLHNFNALLANQQDPTATIEDLKTGKLNLKDNQAAKDWVKLLDLTVKYGQKNPLTTDYNTQVTDFAAGKAAIMQQGNWTQVQVEQINPEIKVGILPMPISNTPNNKIFVGVPNNWVVNKNSPVAKEAKEFLNWLATSEKGKHYIVKEFKFIPAFKSIPFEAADLGDMAGAIQEYTQKGDVLGWHFAKLPDGAFQEVASQMQGYMAQKISSEQLLDNISKAIQSLATK